MKVNSSEITVSNKMILVPTKRRSAADCWKHDLPNQTSGSKDVSCAHNAAIFHTSHGGIQETNIRLRATTDDAGFIHSFPKLLRAR